jgi:hypothetical protein
MKKKGKKETEKKIEREKKMREKLKKTSEFLC